jgi:hypothetical protein
MIVTLIIQLLGVHAVDRILDCPPSKIAVIFQNFQCLALAYSIRVQQNHSHHGQVLSCFGILPSLNACLPEKLDGTAHG